LSGSGSESGARREARESMSEAIGGLGFEREERSEEGWLWRDLDTAVRSSFLPLSEGKWVYEGAGPGVRRKTETGLFWRRRPFDPNRPRDLKLGSSGLPC
jgi:hypothetical protein